MAYYKRGNVTEYDSDWDELEEMIDDWIAEAELSEAQMKGFEPIQKFVVEQTGSDQE